MHVRVIAKIIKLIKGMFESWSASKYLFLVAPNVDLPALLTNQ